jgi:hypothetical protein
VRENCFGLVVGGMCHHDARGPARRNHALEKGVAEPPGGIFNVPFVLGGRCRYIFALDYAFDLVRAGQVRHKFSVPARFRSAKTMIEVGHQQRDSKAIAESFE